MARTAISAWLMRACCTVHSPLTTTKPASPNGLTGSESPSDLTPHLRPPHARRVFGAGVSPGENWQWGGFQLNAGLYARNLKRVRPAHQPPPRVNRCTSARGTRQSSPNFTAWMRPVRTSSRPCAVSGTGAQRPDAWSRARGRRIVSADLVRFSYAQRLEGHRLNFADRQQSKPRPHHVRITRRQTEILKLLERNTAALACICPRSSPTGLT